jgi:hypothetical protein
MLKIINIKYREFKPAIRFLYVVSLPELLKVLVPLSQDIFYKRKLKPYGNNQNQT